MEDFSLVMSLVILTTKASNAEQFGRFIDSLEGTISAYNSSLEAEGENASGKPIEVNSFVSRARELLNGNDLHGLLRHILSLENALLVDPRGMKYPKMIKFNSCCQFFHHFGFVSQQNRKERCPKTRNCRFNPIHFQERRISK